MNINSKSIEMFYSQIAEELDLSRPMVKHTVDTMFSKIRQELKRPTKKGILLHNFCAITPRPKSLKALIERRKEFLSEADSQYWQNYLQLITKEK